MELLSITVLIIFTFVTFKPAATNCRSNPKIYTDKIDVEKDYDDQVGIGWSYNTYDDRKWFYSDTWPDLSGNGVWLVNRESGPLNKKFSIDAFFSKYDDLTFRFYFELKYYSTVNSSLHNIIIDGGIESPAWEIPKSERLVWSTLQFEAKPPRLSIAVKQH